MLLTENRREIAAPMADSLEPFAPSGVEEGADDRRAAETGASSERGAPHEAHPAPPKIRRTKPWRIRVVRIDAQKYPQFKSDGGHPFSALSREARVEEIDVFLARVLARSKKFRPPVGVRMNPAPVETLAASESPRPI